MLKGLPDWQILKIVKNDGMRGHNLKLRAFRYELDSLMAQCAKDFETHAEDMLWELKYEPTPARFEELTEELADIASETAPDLVRQIEGHVRQGGGNWEVVRSVVDQAAFAAGRAVMAGSLAGAMPLMVSSVR